MADIEATQTPPGKLDKFNRGLAYYLNNIFKFIWTVAWFFIKLSGVLLFVFPFVLFGMCLVSPDSAIKTLEALTHLLQLIINLFRGVS